MNAKLAAAALSAIIAAGCITKRSGGTAFRERRWTEGVTTRQDVVGAWGNPDAMDGNVWIWREKRHLGGKLKASYYGIGLSVSEMNVVTYEHRLAFDGSGLLRGNETHRSVSGGERWSLFPW